MEDDLKMMEDYLQMPNMTMGIQILDKKICLCLENAGLWPAISKQNVWKLLCLEIASLEITNSPIQPYKKGIAIVPIFEPRYQNKSFIACLKDQDICHLLVHF